MRRYTLTAIALHWLMAILIIAAFLLGLTMVDIPGITPTKLKYFSWHKWLGVSVFGLACLRLLWALSHPAPAHPANMADWQKKAARVSHGLMYVLIFAVPLSGYFYSLAAGVPVVYLGIVPLPVFIGPDPELRVLLRQVHYACNVVLLIVFFLHILAVIKHQLIDRDRTLQRMLP